ncbi:MAG: SdiA-regulated domain-containing protein [Longimicrobiales bacterium]|nr:SdiA-regulated domain-containing protein [Longimicrobiales bacterium]
MRTDARAETGSVEASGIGPDGATSVLGRYDLRQPVRRFDLPGRLDEISGLALTEDGRLLAHDDERARVHVIDRLTGEVGKSFDLGSGEVRDDFEGIARIGERLFLASSRGFLYEFREGADDADVAYRVTNTRLGRDCEVEGLDYDAGTDALVFACKESTQGRDFLVLHRLPVAPDAERPPPLLVPRGRLESVGLDPAFRPSAVLVTSEDTFLLLSATTESILEVDREGNIVSGSRLDVGAHAQPEGLAMDADGLLYIADEENDNDARITVYAPAGNAP